MNFTSLFFRLSTKEKMLFARHMEMMTRSGMQLIGALEILKKQTKSKAFISMIDQLILDLRNGHFLSVGLERYKHVFGEFFINLIRIGEQSGTLTDNFKYLAEELGKKEALKKKVKGAMIYPLVILAATFGITGVLIFGIFPKILPVLKNLNVELPATTRTFIFLSEYVLNNGVFLGLLLLAIIVGTIFLLRIKSVRFVWHTVLIRLPVVGVMSQNVNIINFARTLTLLLRGGVQIVEALNISGRTMTNMVYQKEIGKISENVQKGEPISKSLIASAYLFPATFSQMVAVGENTGKLEETLQFLADFYDGELDESTKTMSNVLEPLLLLTMGLIVGFVALGIITPIYKITQTLGR